MPNNREGKNKWGEGGGGSQLTFRGKKHGGRRKGLLKEVTILTTKTISQFISFAYL